MNFFRKFREQQEKLNQEAKLEDAKTRLQKKYKADVKNFKSHVWYEVTKFFLKEKMMCLDNENCKKFTMGDLVVNVVDKSDSYIFDSNELFPSLNINLKLELEFEKKTFAYSLIAEHSYKTLHPNDKEDAISLYKRRAQVKFNSRQVTCYGKDFSNGHILRPSDASISNLLEVIITTTEEKQTKGR